MNQEFYSIGSRFHHKRFGECILAQVGPGVGTFIMLNGGNRLSDHFNLQYDGNYGVYHDVLRHFDLVPINLDVERSNVRERILSVIENAQKETQQGCNPRFIEFFRHIRPFSYLTCETDNLKGITLAIRLDYTKKIAKYGVSICDGDNFEKASGRERAKRRLDTSDPDFSFTVSFSDYGIDKEGAVPLLISHFIRGGENKPNMSLVRKNAIRKIISMYEAQ